MVASCYQQVRIPTAEQMIAVERALRHGLPRDLVLQAHGIAKDRMARIQELARKGVEPHRTWIASVEQAEAEGKAEHLMKLAQSPDWRAREKILMLTEPDLFKGVSAEHTKTYEWMLRVISEETDERTFERILSRFATEEPGGQVESPKAGAAEGKLH